MQRFLLSRSPMHLSSCASLLKIAEKMIILKRSHLQELGLKTYVLTYYQTVLMFCCISSPGLRSYLHHFSFWDENKDYNRGYTVGRACFSLLDHSWGLYASLVLLLKMDHAENKTQGYGGRAGLRTRHKDFSSEVPVWVSCENRRFSVGPKTELMRGKYNRVDLCSIQKT